MATLYVRSTDGNNADDGSTWALADATVAASATAGAAGDTHYVSDAHAETQASSMTIAFAGTASNPSKLICGDDAAEPPTATATTATITTTGASPITMTGSLIAHGITFKSGSSGGASLTLNPGDQHTQRFYDCNFELGSNTTTNRFTIGSGTGGTESLIYLSNCTFKCAATAQGLSINYTTSFVICGGSILSGSSAITTFFATTPVNKCDPIIIGFDFSNAATALNIFPASVACGGYPVLRNCKMPASWSGGLVAGAPTNPGFRASMYNCDSGDTNYRLWIETYAGTIRDETVIVKTSGMTDGTTPISWKMTTNANTNKWVAPLISDWYVFPNTTTGSAVTITAEIIHDSATALKDDEVWIEAETVTTSGGTLGGFADDKCVLLATAADQATSSVSWTTTGITNVNKQECVTSITPQEAGLIRVRIYLAKASYTAYVGEITKA